MTGGGHGRVRRVIAVAREMAEGAEPLLDIAPRAPPGVDGEGPSEADAALLGVLLALADLAIDHQQEETRR